MRGANQNMDPKQRVLVNPDRINFFFNRGWTFCEHQIIAFENASMRRWPRGLWMRPDSAYTHEHMVARHVNPVPYDGDAGGNLTGHGDDDELPGLAGVRETGRRSQPGRCDGSCNRDIKGSGITASVPHMAGGQHANDMVFPTHK